MYQSTNVEQSANVDVVMIIDSSGSMLWNDPGDKRLQAARTYLSASTIGDFVGVIDFDSTVRVANPLESIEENLTSLRGAVDTIDSSGGTNIGLGVQNGCDELADSISGNPVRAGILLTDGVGAFNDEDSCFKKEGWRIFTFGIGDADTALLEQIAENTGGVFSELPTSKLICEFQVVRANVVGADPGSCTSYDVAPNESILFAVTVPEGQGVATFSSSWIGSDVIMTLTTPSGRVINRFWTDWDVVHDNGASFEVITITSPESGDWEVELFGAEIPPEGEEVVFGFTSIPKLTASIDINIMPGSEPNPINPKSKGMIPVAILTTDTFDASTVDALSIAFSWNGAAEGHGKGHIEDADGDGDFDLVLHFNIQDTGIACGDTFASIIGTTFDGQAIKGSDSLRTVNCN